ncbi:MAG: hypothetical protein IKN17_00260 [Ruminococcus sp.]|nr:hypothetical protein [Ruminococcus sp.]
MPKLIRQYPAAILESAVRSDGNDHASWEWREKYIGVEGVLSVYESINKAPGKCFFRMEYYGGYKLMPAEGSPDELEIVGEGRFFTTSPGEMTDAGDELWLKTRNSEYVFKLIQK